MKRSILGYNLVRFSRENAASPVMWTPLHTERIVPVPTHFMTTSLPSVAGGDEMTNVLHSREQGNREATQHI